jgi:parvulin-like peptidyl-prolyl isomerase
VFQGQLSSEENSALSKMPIGGYAVVRTSRGYVILYLRDKKDAGVRSFTTMRFVQVVIPFPEPNPSKEVREQLNSYLIDLKNRSANCHEFIKNAKSSGICGVSDQVTMVLEEVQPQFRAVLTLLQAGGIGYPIATPNGLVVICMLNRNTQTIPDPTSEDIRERKINERLSVFGDREIHDLYKRADIKIK